MSNRALQVGGLAILGGVGYYMYAAGGDPKAAQKRAEADAQKLKNEVQEKVGSAPDAKEVKKDAEVGAQDARAKADQLARDAKAKANEVDARLESLRKDAAKELDKAAKNTEQTLKQSVDKFDKNVTEGASKAKSGISGWFGGGEKK